MTVRSQLTHDSKTSLDHQGTVMLSNGYLKRYVRCCLLIIGLCPALLYAQSSPNAEDKLVRIASGEWPPFIGSDLPNYGFVGEIITQAFTKQGYQVEFQFLPWARAYAETQRGLYDATAIWMHSAEREVDFFYSLPVSQEEFVFFYPVKKPFDWKTLSDLAPYKLGGVLAYSYGKELDALLDSGVLTMERDGLAAKNLEKLAKGRVDLVPEEKHIGYYLINQQIPHLQDLITHHPTPFLTNSNYLLFPKQSARSQELLGVFNHYLVQTQKKKKK
ncbi:transporter substrate-binding domain-containing protein [Vibrio cholerae]|nr:transporter substrate-binding domain-containing protein [Vibrio cholerae]